MVFYSSPSIGISKVSVNTTRPIDRSTSCCSGTLYTSLFVLGHDCGHGSFSFYPLLNDIVGELVRTTRDHSRATSLFLGTILHTWILAPYYTWKVHYHVPSFTGWLKRVFLLQITHNHHHKNTCNIDKDEVFYPQRGTTNEPSLADDIFYWLPGFGWFHYLIKGYSPRTVNHFNPVEKRARLIDERKSLLSLQVWTRLLQSTTHRCLDFAHPLHGHGEWSSISHPTGSRSISSGTFQCYLMYLYAASFGFLNLVAYHLIPVFIFASYMVIITMLHHTEV